MFIDTHVHTFDPAFGSFEFPPVGSVYHRLLRTQMIAEDSGEEFASCVVVGCSNEYELNIALLKSVEEDPLTGAYIA